MSLQPHIAPDTEITFRLSMPSILKPGFEVTKTASEWIDLPPEEFVTIKQRTVRWALGLALQEWQLRETFTGWEVVK